MAEMKDRLRADLTAAMKAKDTFVTGVLRMAMAAIMNEEVAGTSARELTGDEELAIVTREVRKRRESAQAYRDGNRAELAEKEEREIEVLSVYLPAPLTEAELDQIVAEEVSAVDEASMKHMGLIIKAVNARAQGRADGSLVAAKVRAALSG
ncbi:MAG: GatB/YqeY domain-containing protein [Propionibacteriaceae bacterium]|nr:GatB/YqeY domain-containing protein [Propionibacteriaceae bacterium]